MSLSRVHIKKRIKVFAETIRSEGSHFKANAITLHDGLPMSNDDMKRFFNARGATSMGDTLLSSHLRQGKMEAETYFTLRS